MRWVRWVAVAGVGAALAVGGCDCASLPTAPLDYADDAHWLALPSRVDAADAVPSGEGVAAVYRTVLVDNQASAPIDVFYVHPTTWIETFSTGNAPLDDEDANREAEAAARYQASAFNYAGRVFAPRYRQASLITYADDISGDAPAVIEAAYRDVEAAFAQYLDARSSGRDFVLVGHSQGASHLVRLLRDHVDGQPLAERLVAAYLIGELVGPETFTSLQPCAAPTARGCVVTYASARAGASPDGACGAAGLSKCIDETDNTTQTPWCVDPIGGVAGGASPASANRGAGPGLGLGSGVFGRLYPGLVATRCDEQGVLRVDDSGEVDGVSAADFADVDEGDYHVQDVNLFWLDLRLDAARRAGMDVPG